MPKRYEAIRDSLMRQGLSEKQAKTRAAKIYHSTLKRGEKKLDPHHKKRS